MVGWLRRVLKVHTFEIHFKHLKSLFVFHQVKGVYLRLLNISKGLFLPFYKGLEDFSANPVTLRGNILRMR